MDESQLDQVRDTVLAFNQLLLELDRTNDVVLKLAKSGINDKEESILGEVALEIKSILESIENGKRLCGILYQIGSGKMN